jgi:hypothetical protein
LSDGEARNAIAAAARTLGFPAAAREIAADIIALIQSRDRGSLDRSGVTTHTTDKRWN